MFLDYTHVGALKKGRCQWDGCSVEFTTPCGFRMYCDRHSRENKRRINAKRDQRKKVPSKHE